MTCFVLTLALSSAVMAVLPQQARAAAAKQSLYATVSKLDAGLFDAFNHCSSPAQLKKHASYLAPNLEFYHDKGGVTWTRQAYMANTEKNVCGHYRRVLIPGTLEVFPIKNYGAIEQGRHKFCEIKSDKCFGEAQFLIVWHQTSDKWVATRILSYGHEPIQPKTHGKTR
ncbi:DUF4440 domain-containing protein [Oleiagrimonas sp. MCCC 1A03011]|nr:DUF4440 domain-containing protein [Oleiagrimonas sp. MCCC 1A03011]